MHPLLRIIKYMKRKTLFAIGVVIFTAILDSAFTLVSPYIIREIINNIFYEENFVLRFNALKLWIPILIAIGFLASIFRFVQRYINEYISQNVIYDLRNRLYTKIQRQSIDFFDRMETGQLISRGTSDVEAIRRLLSIGLRIFLRSICLYTGIFVIVGLMDWQLMLIFVGFAPVMFISMFM
ncbi:MAG: ABC transporter transmembrane domain-containing protein, partial [Candidatus Heimdallarchaeota archaeon]